MQQPNEVKIPGFIQLLNNQANMPIQRLGTGKNIEQTVKDLIN